MLPNPLKVLLPELQKQDGVLWARILAETHPQYGEIPFWVLVKDVTQITRALPFLQKALTPLRSDPHKVTTAFLSLTRTQAFSLGMFEGDEFFAAHALEQLYREPIKCERWVSVFDIEYPNDPYAIVDLQRPETVKR